MSDKTFIGKVDVIATQYGEIIKLKFGPQDFEKMAAAKNEGGWLHIDIKSGKNGKYAEVNNYKASGAAPQSGGKRVQSQAPVVNDDLPF